MIEQEDLSLKVPQARILSILMPPDPEGTDPFDWPMVTRGELMRAAGYSSISGTINRVMNGIPEGSSSGLPHPGLIQRGMLELHTLDIEGVKEVNYKITPRGVEALKRYIEVYGSLPELRDAKVCTNERYTEVKPELKPGQYRRRRT